MSEVPLYAHLNPGPESGSEHLKCAEVNRERNVSFVPTSLPSCTEPEHSALET